MTANVHQVSAAARRCVACAAPGTKRLGRSGEGLIVSCPGCGSLSIRETAALEPNAENHTENHTENYADAYRQANNTRFGTANSPYGEYHRATVH